MSRDISKRTAVWAGLAVAVAITVTSVVASSLGHGGAEPLPVRDNVVHAVPLHDSSAPAVLEVSTTTGSAVVLVESSTGNAAPVLTSDAPAPAVAAPPAVLAADAPAPAAPAPALAADVPADDPPTLNPNDPFANGPTAPPGYTAPPTQPAENPTPTPDPGH